MALSDDLISQFAKITKDDSKEQTEKTVYGTIVEYNSTKYVQLDGSELLTPVSITTNADADDRVTVMIKNHTATVTGNISSPAARTAEVDTITDAISAFETIVANKANTLELNAEKARIDQLRADVVTVNNTLTANVADVTTLEADVATINDTLTANEATITTLEAEVVTVTGRLNAADADIESLQANTALISDTLTAANANISNLEVDKLSATDASLQFANIDFSNIGEAAMQYFYANSGLIQNVIVDNASVTGQIVGVTISGDRIIGNTIVADKLVILGEDGFYYALNTNGMTTELEQTDYNSLNGSIIKAHSVTASKINVTDLVAFGATIGGFVISDHSLYSGVKTTATNTARGIYMDDSGQLAFGDADNYVRFFENENEECKLEIKADSIVFGINQTNVEEEFAEIASDFQQTIVEQNTSIANDCEEAIIEALVQYTETGDFEEYRATIESQLSALSDDLNSNFVTATTQLEAANSNLTNKLSTYEKHIRLTDNGISIADTNGDKNVELRLDSGFVQFYKNGELHGWWDGEDFHTGNIIIDVNERAQFGSFAFVPRSDGSLSFLKVSGDTVPQELDEPMNLIDPSVFGNDGGNASYDNGVITIPIDGTGSSGMSWAYWDLSSLIPGTSYTITFTADYSGWLFIGTHDSSTNVSDVEFVSGSNTHTFTMISGFGIHLFLGTWLSTTSSLVISNLQVVEVTD